MCKAKEEVNKEEGKKGQAFTLNGFRTIDKRENNKGVKGGHQMPGHDTAES